MITHERLVESVSARAPGDRSEDAAHVARTVVADLSLHLGIPERRRLQRALPAADRDAAYAIVPARKGDAPEFLHAIGEHLGVPPEQARELARGVLSTLGTSDPELLEDLRPHLPPGIAELFGPGEGGS